MKLYYKTDADDLIAALTVDLTLTTVEKVDALMARDQMKRCTKEQHEQARLKIRAEKAKSNQGVMAN